jgi:hypothetical protein
MLDSIIDSTSEANSLTNPYGALHERFRKFSDNRPSQQCLAINNGKTVGLKCTKKNGFVCQKSK